MPWKSRQLIIFRTILIRLQPVPKEVIIQVRVCISGVQDQDSHTWLDAGYSYSTGWAGTEGHRQS